MRNTNSGNPVLLTQVAFPHQHLRAVLHGSCYLTLLVKDAQHLIRQMRSVIYWLSHPMGNSLLLLCTVSKRGNFLMCFFSHFLLDQPVNSARGLACVLTTRVSGLELKTELIGHHKFLHEAAASERNNNLEVDLNLAQLR